MIPTVSALLIAAFLANASWWGHGISTSPCLMIAALIAFWLLYGLVVPTEDPARTVVGSPWVASSVALVPFWLTNTWVNQTSPLVANAAGAVTFFVLALIPLSRARSAWVRIADWKQQAALTLLVVLASTASMRTTAAESTA